MSTFVSVGNATQAFMRLLHVVDKLAPNFPQPVFVQYGSAITWKPENCQSSAFMSMEEFSGRVSDASLLILHAGAGSILHAVRAGKVPVVVPRRATLGEHIDDHQVEFARELATLGKVVLCEDVAELATAVSRALQLQVEVAGGADEAPLVGRIRTILHEPANIPRSYKGEIDN